MLEFLLALLTTATVGALLWPLLRPRLDSRDRLSAELAKGKKLEDFLIR